MKIRSHTRAGLTVISDPDRQRDPVTRRHPWRYARVTRAGQERPRSRTLYAALDKRQDDDHVGGDIAIGGGVRRNRRRRATDDSYGFCRRRLTVSAPQMQEVTRWTGCSSFAQAGQ
jgi:hypothetical protein